LWKLLAKERQRTPLRNQIVLDAVGQSETGFRRKRIACGKVAAVRISIEVLEHAPRSEARWGARQQGRTASVAVHFSAENMPENLDAEIQTTCYRIAQEAITNAVRHADATQIDVDLRCENGKLRLLIRDDGVGFDVESVQAQAVGLDLTEITERAALVGGRARIISSSGKGTAIEVVLPLTLRDELASRGLTQ
jgi:signal transduction histidine kinase